MASARRVFKYFAFCSGVIIGILATIFLIALGRTLTLQELNFEADLYLGKNYPLEEDQLQKYVGIFANSIKFKTVSTAPGNQDLEELFKLQLFLKKEFPSVFGSPFVQVETVNNYSLLLTVKGSDPNFKPYMLISHMDVVPVVPEQWTHDPFLGEVVVDPVTGEDVIWGRGTLDDKIGVVGILSALDLLLQLKWQPKRSFYVGFGHDEEVRGTEGAGNIGRLLQQRGVTLDFLLDEGLPITKGFIKGVDSPIAIIGVAEKGRMNVELSVEAVGGHSSIPHSVQAIGVLSTALHKIYTNPQPSMFGLGPEVGMFKYLAPKASWPYKLLYANTWLFGPLLSYVMSKSSISDAVVRTTTAITMVKGGIKENVIPSTAWALINHRVHPSQTLEAVLAHDAWAISDDRVKLKMTESAEPHPISPYGQDCLPFMLIVGAIKHAFPDAVPVPGLMIANTDTTFYLGLTSFVYRMLPVFLETPDSVASYHGKNERLSLSNFEALISFYLRLIVSAEVEPRPKIPSVKESGEL